MNGYTENAALTVDPLLFRKQALLSSGACFLVSMLYFAADFPHGAEIGAMALIASALYGLFYLFFNQLYARGGTQLGILLSGIAIIMLAFVVHFSGGVTSPFMFLYFILLISEAVYGLQNPVTLPLAVSTYGFVCVGEAAGFLQPANSWAAAVYKSNVVTFILVVMTIVFMWMTRYITGLIVLNLRVSLERENLEKHGLLNKFSELNSSAQIGVLAHRIAHDLRGPMAAISGYIQMEQLNENTPDKTAALKDLDEIVTNMSESLSGITRFGRTSASAVEKVDLADFVNTLIAIVSFSPHARGVKFRKLYPARTSLSVNASRPDLQQAYFNLIKNAVEAVRDNADGKLIEIEISAEGRDAVVSVSDNGPGVLPEILKSLFRKSLTTKKDGTGVGLMITRDLLLRNEGDIELRNRPEGGLKVITRLPLA